MQDTQWNNRFSRPEPGAHSGACRAGRYDTQAGFTLLEMLISVTILSILMLVATPNLKGFTAGQEIKTSTQALHVALLTARSEAIKQNNDVYLHPASDTGWQDGWYISAEAVARNIACDDPAPDAGIIRSYCGPADGDIRIDASQASVAFTPGGRADQASFVLCHAQHEGHNRTLWLDLAGMPEVESGGACS